MQLLQICRGVIVRIFFTVDALRTKTKLDIIILPGQVLKVKNRFFCCIFWLQDFFFYGVSCMGVE